MKKSLLLCSAFALLTLSAGARAQDYHGPDRMGGPEHQDQDHHDQAPQPHRWARGQRVPTEYRGHDHEVDWHAHHLRRPPHGYHWVQADNQYALVGINTGTISAVIDIR